MRRHAELGDGLLPWAAGLFVPATAVWWTTRRSTSVEAAPGEQKTRAAAPRSALVVRAVAVVLSVGVAAGAVVDVYRQRLTPSARLPVGDGTAPLPKRPGPAQGIRPRQPVAL
ncbi:hypothetical protein ACWY4P_20515 [Streptomyces sp. LZ34]